MGLRHFVVFAGVPLLAALLYFLFSYYAHESPNWEATIVIAGSKIDFKRTQGGTMEFWCSSAEGFARGMGYAHARDRLTQLELQRLAGRGLLSEKLESNPKTTGVDVHLRGMGFGRDADLVFPLLPEKARKFFEAYAEGINHRIKQIHSATLPFLASNLELNLAGHIPSLWKPADTLVIMKLVMYLGLATGQGEVEEMLLHSLRKGVDYEILQALFPHFVPMAPEHIDILRGTPETGTLLFPSRIKFAYNLDALTASNNWVLSGEKTTSGSVYQCNDPHMEYDRLPGVWYEFIVHRLDQNRNFTGIGMPGHPLPVMGRTDYVSYGATNGFIDQIDYFIEEVRNGRYRVFNPKNDSQKIFHDFVRHEEIFKPKGEEEITRVYLETKNNVMLMLPDYSPEYVNNLPDGYYISRTWTWSKLDPAEFAHQPPEPANNVYEMQDILKTFSVSANFLVGDTSGNIMYQQTGKIPKRPAGATGMVPYPSWEYPNYWEGFSVESLNSVINPAKGFIATANDAWQKKGEGVSLSINAHMGGYRRNRMDHLLSQDKKFSIQDMKDMQFDVFSGQAERFLTMIKEENLADDIADTCLKRSLLEWDYFYERTANGPVVFEELYEQLNKRLFTNFFGEDGWRELLVNTAVFNMYHHYFDEVFFNPRFNGVIWKRIGVTRNEFVHSVLKDVLEQTQEEGETTEQHTLRIARKCTLQHKDISYMTLSHIVLDKKVPEILGWDVPNVYVAGCRSCLHQAQFATVYGFDVVVGPSWRYITDLGTDQVWSSLSSGVSDRRFSGMFYNPGFFEGNYYEHNFKRERPGT